MSKYDPLHDFLANIPSNVNEKTLRFGDIENILGFKLPQSASTHRAWQAKSTNCHR